MQFGRKYEKESNLRCIYMVYEGKAKAETSNVR